MLAPNFTAANFLAAMKALMPRGRVWPTDFDTVQTQVLQGFAPSYERQTARANYLLIDSFPGTTYELLPEWEETLGLPDPCAGPAATVPQRRNQVIARFSNSGGASVQYFVTFAQTLGYSISIEQYTQARAGMLKAGDPCCGYDWNFAWKITAPINTVVRALAGAMAAGDPLASWGNKVLECEFLALRPAHTIPIFAYA
ncbi:YmfQ family protein [Pandoraea sputorum]|uniref:YmfQ family protein n=1 Tax=Pandoraea sputorum TaxID=93222 RepID=UPI001240B2BA|nr:putative phage tail protein [Pandoraea sputorum]VVE06456.1 phage tail protein [Pandoraea sputorum]